MNFIKQLAEEAATNHNQPVWLWMNVIRWRFNFAKRNHVADIEWFISRGTESHSRTWP